MRNVLISLSLICTLGFPAAALADVGPAPSCPSGTHSAYLYGRRCVRDGYHLEGKAGEVQEVPDATPVATPPSKEPTKEPTKEPSKASGGCEMSQSGDRSPGLGLLCALGLGLALSLRRRASQSRLPA